MIFYLSVYTMDNSFNPNFIPGIGTMGPIGTQPQMNPMNTIQAQKEKKEKIIFGNEPNDITLKDFCWKIFIWLLSWGIISVILFLFTGVIGGILGDNGGAPTSILWIVLAAVGFITGMIGNMGCALLFNILFSKRYYNLSKMLGLIFTSSMIIFVAFVPIYLLFPWTVTTAYSICGFQIIFSFFITICLMDFLSHPNYSASSLMGNLLGFMFSSAAYLVLVNITNSNSEDIETNTLLLLIVPSILGYTVTLFGSGIWDAIYYKLFEWGNNPFYLPSLTELKRKEQEELAKQEKDNESVNVDRD